MNRFVTVSGLVVVLVVGSAGCRTRDIDKQGHATPGAVTVLTFGAADPTDSALSYFVDAVDRRSGHGLRVDVDNVTYFSEGGGGEARLAGDLQAGRIDFAYIPSRDWATAMGDPGFRAVQSPFEITTTQATVALARSSVAIDLLGGMARYDVVGLGLIPAEPRRLVTKNPLLSAADLKGSRVKISDSDQTASLISALGGVPVPGMTASQAHSALETDSLEGVETAPVYVSENSYNVRAPYLTSFALIPKFEIIAASRGAWAGLSEADQEILQTAVAQTVSHTAEQVLRDESRELAQLCSNGLVVVRPSAQALQEMADIASAAVTRDAPTRLALDRIAGAVPGVGPQEDASPIPPACEVATTGEQARTLRASSHDASPSSSSPLPEVSIPPGTYEVTLTTEQMAAAGLSGLESQSDITYTWTFEADGTFREFQQPDYPDQGPGSGKYVVAGDTVTFTFDFSPTGTLSPEKVRWSFYQGTLTLTSIAVQDPVSRLIYEQPWRKIA